MRAFMDLNRTVTLNDDELAQIHDLLYAMGDHTTHGSAKSIIDGLRRLRDRNAEASQ